MDDLISRQAAIEALGDEPEVWTEGDEYAQGRNNQWHYDRNAIMALTAAQRWIPVSERLPEPRTAVLAYTPKYGNIWALYYDKINGWMVWSPIADDFFPYSQGDVIAWMPMPEPYKEMEAEG